MNTVTFSFVLTCTPDSEPACPEQPVVREKNVMKTQLFGLLLAGLLGPASALADGGTILVSGGRGGSYMDDGGTIVVSGGRGGSYMDDGGTLVVSGG